MSYSQVVTQCTFRRTRLWTRTLAARGYRFLYWPARTGSVPKLCAECAFKPSVAGHILDIRFRQGALMVWVWLVTTSFVIATFVTTKLRGSKKLPRALRDAITADAIFGALLLIRTLL
jgi:hypothetical protein